VLDFDGSDDKDGGFVVWDTTDDVVSAAIMMISNFGGDFIV
jgi:hypothetical protein